MNQDRMKKKVVLSERQLHVVALMKRGFRLWNVSGVGCRLRGHGQFPPGSVGNEGGAVGMLDEHVHQMTVEALENKGIIALERRDHGHLLYTLTQVGIDH